MSAHNRQDMEQERKMIMIVEDDEVHASLLYQIIRQETAYQVCYTSDGQTAWKFLQHMKPHLLILDYLLPGLNGLQLYDNIHASERLRDIPVMIVSAALPKDEIQKRGLVGIQKPFELEDFLHKIDELIIS